MYSMYYSELLHHQLLFTAMQFSSKTNVMHVHRPNGSVRQLANCVAKRESA